MKNLLSNNFFLLLLYVLVSCTSPDKSKPVPNQLIPATPVQPVPSLTWTNDSHLKALYSSVKMQNGVEVGTIGIYADYPLYKVFSAQGEGFTCLDEVSRAAIFYLNKTDIGTKKESRTDS